MKEYSESDLKKAHKLCINNKPALDKVAVCGCFYCLSIYKPSEIEEWLFAEPADTLGTALCPYCGIDSVLSESCGYPITRDFLAKMEKYWFNN